MVSLFIGERKEGKTSLALWRAQQRTSVILVFEPKPDETTEGKGIFVSTGDELHEELEKAKRSKSALIFFVPSDDITEGFNEFIDVIKCPDPKVRYAFGGISIIVDEGWTLMSANHSHPELQKLMRLAPKDGPNQINVSVLAHKPKDINQKTHFFSDEVFCFRVDKSNAKDLETLHEFYSFEFSETVSNFPKGKHFVARYDKDTQSFSVWDKPEVWNIHK